MGHYGVACLWAMQAQWQVEASEINNQAPAAVGDFGGEAAQFAAVGSAAPCGLLSVDVPVFVPGPEGARQALALAPAGHETPPPSHWPATWVSAPPAKAAISLPAVLPVHPPPADPPVVPLAQQERFNTYGNKCFCGE